MTRPLRKIVCEVWDSFQCYDLLECGHRVLHDFGGKNGVERAHKSRRCAKCADAA